MPKQPQDLVGKVLEFNYHNVARKVSVEMASLNGSMFLVTGPDESRDGAYRSFNIDPYEIGNTVHIIN
jgi:hypothetical protein